MVNIDFRRAPAQYPRLQVTDMPALRCEHCDELLRSYREAVQKFTVASERLMDVAVGLESDFYARAFRDVTIISEECTRIRDAFLLHVRSHSALSIALGSIPD